MMKMVMMTDGGENIRGWNMPTDVFGTVKSTDDFSVGMTSDDFETGNVCFWHVLTSDLWK